MSRVTVVIPARNEERHIGAVLRCITEGTYEAEVIVADGMSTDRTREIVQSFCQRFTNIRLIDNRHQTVPFAMNAGIAAASGEIIVRMDAHAKYPPDYIEQLVLALEALKADNVGGVWETKPGADTSEARAVAVILSSRFGIGSATYRLGTEKPTEVDTVPFGCYRKKTLEKLGLYDERFTRNQDDELNARLKMAGGRIFLVPSIRIEYFARETLWKMARMLYQYGYFKPAIALKLGRPATLRQFAPPLFVASIAAAPLCFLISPILGLLAITPLAAHIAVNFMVSTKAARSIGFRSWPFLLAGFLAAHVSYGVGYLLGLVDSALMRRQQSKAVPITR